MVHAIVTLKRKRRGNQKGELIERVIIAKRIIIVFVFSFITICCSKADYKRYMIY